MPPATPATRKSLRRPLIKQWLLKRAMELTFHRQSVRYFACGPLRRTSLCYFDVARHPGVRGHVALSLDDAPCRLGGDSRLVEVMTMLDRHGAAATFMVVGSYVEGHEEELTDLIRGRRHELGNHGMEDRPYHQDSPEGFGADVDACSERIRSVQHRANVNDPETVRWFRAPHGKYTRSMEAVLHSRGLTNVMCDTYASCPIVEDGEYIGRMLARNAREGSIILLHMPERGFRDWCMVALRRLLEQLESRDLRIVTVSELGQLADREVIPT